MLAITDLLFGTYYITTLLPILYYINISVGFYLAIQPYITLLIHHTCIAIEKIGENLPCILSYIESIRQNLA